MAFWFILTLLLAFLLLVIFGKLLRGKTKHKYSNFVLRWWSIIWGLIIFQSYRQVGRNMEHTKKTMVLVTNHNSYLDTVVSYVNIRHLFKTLAKKELQKAPLMGPIFLTSGIMVDRSSPESRHASFERMVDNVKAGVSVLIFPEGTQNRTKEYMQPFYDGAFRLAIEAQVPILPLVTVNSRRLMPQAKFGKIKPGTIRQHFLEPISTEEMTEADVPDLKEKVREIMLAKLKELDPKYPD